MNKTIEYLAILARRIDNPEGISWNETPKVDKEIWLTLSKTFYQAAQQLGMIK